MTVFGFTDVTVRHGAVAALDGVSFDVGPGQVVVVVGGDGAGKTTLCRVLAGLTRISSGHVRVPPRRDIGDLPATSGVWPDLTVEENLGFVANAYRLTKTEYRDRREVLLTTTDLIGATDRLGAQLSGGMRQKLGVAMALLPQPRLLVLDEPTTGIDPVSRFDLWRLVARSAADGTAVVMTTTYLDEAERASAVLALDAGDVLAWGDLDDVRRSSPGTVFTSDTRLDLPNRWRRGAAWRYWSPNEETLPGAQPIEPDLSDVLIAAALARASMEVR